jgi:hypothetical protein
VRLWLLAAGNERCVDRVYFVAPPSGVETLPCFFAGVPTPSFTSGGAATAALADQLDGGTEISMNTNLEPSDTYEDDSAAPPTRHDTDGLHIASKNADVVEAQATAEAPIVQKQENQPPTSNPFVERFGAFE